MKQSCETNNLSEFQLENSNSSINLCQFSANDQNNSPCALPNTSAARNVFLSAPLNSTLCRPNNQRCNTWSQRIDVLASRGVGLARPLDCSAKPLTKLPIEKTLERGNELLDKKSASLSSSITFSYQPFAYGPEKYNSSFHLRNAMFGKAFKSPNYSSVTSAGSSFNSCWSKTMDIGDCLTLPNNSRKCSSENLSGSSSTPLSFKHETNIVTNSANDDWIAKSFTPNVSCQFNVNNNNIKSSDNIKKVYFLQCQ